MRAATNRSTERARPDIPARHTDDRRQRAGTVHAQDPGRYQGRATHIHVEVTRNGQSLKVTQIAFPDSINNDVPCERRLRVARDRIRRRIPETGSSPTASTRQDGIRGRQSIERLLGDVHDRPDRVSGVVKIPWQRFIEGAQIPPACSGGHAVLTYQRRSRRDFRLILLASQPAVRALAVFAPASQGETLMSQACRFAVVLSIALGPAAPAHAQEGARISGFYAGAFGEGEPPRGPWLRRAIASLRASALSSKHSPGRISNRRRRLSRRRRGFSVELQRGVPEPRAMAHT